MENEGFSYLDWRSHLTERQLKEIEFAQFYHRDFRHGTTGHNDLIIIAQLVAMLDNYQMAYSEILESE